MADENSEKPVDFSKLEVPQSDADKTLLPPEGYTSEEWTGLSDTEKQGIIDSIENPEVSEITDGSDIDTAALAKIADESAKPDETPPDDKKPDDAAAKKDDEPPAEAKKPDEAVPKDENLVSDEDLLSYRPVVKDEELELGERVIPEALKQKRAELKTKFDDGDIDNDAYQDGRDAINIEILEYNQKLRSEKVAEKVWEKEQKYFLQNKPEYLRLKDDNEDVLSNKEILFGALNQMVSKISSDPKLAHLNGMQIMIRADKALSKVKESLGLAKSAVAKPAEQKKADDKKPSAKDDLKNADVKTLTDLPTAGSGNIDDAFAQLDKMTGKAYEEALERLPEKVRAAYESRASA